MLRHTEEQKQIGCFARDYIGNFYLHNIHLEPLADKLAAIYSR